MNILKNLTQSEINKILKIKVNDLIFADKESEIFFKWFDCSTYNLPKNEPISLKNGLIKIGNQNPVKPSAFNLPQVSLTKMNLSYEIVSGDKILDGYNETKTTFRSCMTFSNQKDKNVSKLKFYTKNKNIKLLIVKENNKIVGRTLLWKSGKKLFYDNFYCFNPIIENFMESLLYIKNISNLPYGCSIKLNYIPTLPISIGNEKFKIINGDEIPYIDNMVFYDKKTNSCSTKGDNNKIDLNDCRDNDDFYRLFEELESLKELYSI